jgi:hypothetical protein
MKAMKAATTVEYMLALLLGTAAITAPASAARSTNTAGMQGAWLEQSMTCNQVYTKGKKAMTFKNPRNVFAPAFIVSGRRVLTPGANCSIQSISKGNGRDIINLSCATTITSTPIKIFISKTADGALIRYNDNIDKVGSRYEPCSP